MTKMTKKDLKPETKPTKLNIYQKLQIVQAKIGQLKKDQENKFQKYFYVDEYTFLTAVKPLLNEQKLTLTFDDADEEIKTSETETKKGGKEWILQYRKRAILTNTEQPEEQIIAKIWALGQNTDIAKAKGSADTYAVKYFLQKFFLIVTIDNDDPDKKDDGSEPKDKEEDQLSANKPIEKKPEPSKKPEFTPQVTVTITNIKEKFDKNKSKYLLLETDNLPNNVFVFSYKVEESRWSELKEGQNYNFHLEESSQGLLVLLDFSQI